MGTIQRGTQAFRTINSAFFAAGFVTFVTLYDVQPLLPIFAREFRVPAAAGSLVLSVTTASLAVTMLVAGTLSESLGRKPVMVTALLSTSVLTAAAFVSRSFAALLLLRLLEGIVLAGLPAVAMAYLGEEMAPASLNAAMGLYIAGNALGGMAGRIFTVSMTAVLPWRTVMAIVGGACLALSLFFLRRLPASSNFTHRELDLRRLLRSLLEQVKDPGLLYLYGVGFFAMGGFVTLYNYITFRLLAPPYELSPVLVGWIFVVYLVGSASSATVGRMAGRFGRGRVMAVTLSFMAAGAALTVFGGIVAIIGGIVLVTGGFFGTHTVASSWVTARATTSRGQASALYLFFYYAGSSFCGTAGGIFWARFGWNGVAAFIALLVAAGFFLVSRLSRLPEGS